MNSKEKKIIARFELEAKFTAQNFELDPADVEAWVEFVKDPQRFLPGIFEGNWARLDRHPDPGSIRLLSVVKGTDGISRLIGRQEARIFAFPWFK